MVENTIKKSKNKWKLIAIILMVTTAIFLGASIFLFIQLNDSNIKREDIQTEYNHLIDRYNNDVVYGTSSWSTDGKDPQTAAKEAPLTDQYLEIAEWGIKYQIPEGLSDIKYDHGPNYNHNNPEYLKDWENTYYFTANNLTVGYPSCGQLVNLVRSEEPYDKRYTNRSPYYQVGDYYYFVTGTNSNCRYQESGNLYATDTELQKIEQLIKVMLKATPEAM